MTYLSEEEKSFGEGGGEDTQGMKLGLNKSGRRMFLHTKKTKRGEHQ